MTSQIPGVIFFVFCYSTSLSRVSPCRVRAPALSCAVNAPLSCSPGFVVGDRTSCRGQLCRNRDSPFPGQTVSRHRTLSRPRSHLPYVDLVVTQRTLSRNRARRLCHDPEVCVPTQNALLDQLLSRHYTHCRDRKPEFSVATKNSLLTRILCRDKEFSVNQNSLSRQRILCRDRDSKMGSSPFWSSASPVPFFFSFQNTLNSI